VEIRITEHIIRVVVIAPCARLDVASAPQLQERLEAYLADGVQRMVIDLSEVPFMDSAAMAVLVQALKRTRQADGDTLLVWPRQEAARRILQLARFDRIFTIAESAAEALRSF
jgi:anti-anti-sigma factor